MPKTLPTDINDRTAFARFTSEKWGDLDSYYNYWTRVWKRTIDFIKSDHWNVLQEYERDKLPSWKRFPVINYTQRFYNDYVTQILESRVRYSAVPTSPDPQDIAGAELMETGLKYAWDITNMESKRIDLAAWLASCGTAYLRFYWDTNTGNLLPLAVPTPDGGIVPVDPDTLQVDPSISDPFLMDKGEVNCEVVSPQMIRWGQSESEGCMVGMLLTKDEITDRYSKTIADNLSYSKTYAGISHDIAYGASPGMENSEAERALIIEHYIPKSSRYPQGLWWTVAHAGKKLLTKPNPLPSGKVPIATFRWLPVPGHRKLGYSPLHSITYSNKAYDERMARILEWQNKVIPKYLLKNGGGLTHGDINDEPGQELVVNPGGEPEVMEFRQPPASFFNVLQNDLNDMLALGGYTFQQTGKKPDLPGQVTQGNRMREAMEPRGSDQTRLVHINAKAGWQEAGEIIIAYMATFYDDNRMIAVQGPDKQYQWVEFKGQDLDNINATLRVDEASLYPWNRQELRDSMIAMLGTDFGHMVLSKPNGEMDQDKVNAVLNATGMDVSINALDPDVTEARNIISSFKNWNGQDPLPEPQFWQEADVHYEEYIKVLKSQRFQGWPDENKQAFIQYVQGFSDILNQQAEEEANAMLEQEQALRGIREQAELQSDIKKMVAEFILEQLSPVLQQLTSGDFEGSVEQLAETETETDEE